jgi:hypothetical protein
LRKVVAERRPPARLRGRTIASRTPTLPAARNTVGAPREFSAPLKHRRGAAAVTSRSTKASFERELFTRWKTPESRALRHAFRARRGEDSRRAESTPARGRAWPSSARHDGRGIAMNF